MREYITDLGNGWIRLDNWYDLPIEVYAPDVKTMSLREVESNSGGMRSRGYRIEFGGGKWTFASFTNKSTAVKAMDKIREMQAEHISKQTKIMAVRDQLLMNAIRDVAVAIIPKPDDEPTIVDCPPPDLVKESRTRKPKREKPKSSKPKKGKP